ncbi:TNT domain-containing protein [Kitasatospora sp. NPDC056138]|uniref:TNT domain-containing protein n=1 Tax=Kitasatospora sp. NPDC056138 TaxID=3345724 RepID=UPI0035E34B1A
MKARRILTTLAAAAVLFTGSMPAVAQAAAPHATAGGEHNTRIAGFDRSLTECSAEFLEGDRRLGPLRLPVLGIVGKEVEGYRPTDDLGSQRFLDLYWKNGAWVYPAQDGYVLNPDGTPQKAPVGLEVGQDIDRYGSEFGSFLAPEGLPYAQRSIPPASLDGSPAAGCNYHDYRVTKSFTVYTGTIAPWFAQPGLGTQYQLDPSLVPGAPTQGFNVQWLVNNGYLERII